MTQSETDDELLSRWCQHDNRAGSALVKRHFHALHRFFANKAHGHEEDLIQQTFVACVEARDAFRGEGTFRAYLFGLARNALMTHYRRFYRHHELDFTASSLHDLGMSPSSLLAHQQERNLLELALRRLPVDQQLALELTYWQDLSAREVAQVLGLPENTVYSRLHRAKLQLLKLLQEIGESPEQGERAFNLFAHTQENEPQEPPR